MIRTLVDGLFTDEYLAARGLDPTDAATHNDLVTQALDGVLAQQDPLAVRKNLGVNVHGLLDVLQSGSGVEGEVPRRLAALDGLVGIEREVALRLAAYEALYGYLHPALASVPKWMKSKGLSGWWRDMEGRAKRKVVAARFCRHGVLTPKTVSKIRTGQRLPQETNVTDLADRLAGFGIQAPDGDHELAVAEIEFEFRLAIAVSENLGIVRRLLDPQPSDIFAVELHAMRRPLRDLPDHILTSLLRDGTGSNAWPAIEQGLRLVHMQRMFEMARTMQEEAERGVAEMERNPAKSSRALADTLQRQVDFLRNHDRGPGADGPELRIAEVLEGQRDVALLVATDGKRELPEGRPELLDELRADALCMNAMDPWTRRDSRTKERMFREATEAAPWLAYPRRMLAAYLESVDKPDEAIEEFRAAVELNPKNVEGREGLAMLLTEHEMWEEVATVANVSGSATLDALRAWSLLMLDHADEAKTLADEVLTEHPSHSVALRVRAECHRRAGRESEAKKVERKADFCERGVAPPGA